jgi:hypothetical protein
VPLVREGNLNTSVSRRERKKQGAEQKKTAVQGECLRGCFARSAACQCELKKDRGPVSIPNGAMENHWSVLSRE